MPLESIPRDNLPTDSKGEVIVSPLSVVGIITLCKHLTKAFSMQSFNNVKYTVEQSHFLNSVEPMIFNHG